MGVSNATRAVRSAVVTKRGFPSSQYSRWWRKYCTLCGNAAKRGLQCLLTFDEYLDLAKKAGLTSPDDVGNISGKYQMGRRGDVGNYVWGSCRFITVEQNHREMVANGGQARAQLNSGLSRRGRTKETDSGRAAAAEKMTGRTKETHEYLVRASKKISVALAKSFVAFSPTGKRVCGKNVKEFSLKYGLNYSAIKGVFNGTRPHHKNWTGHYVKEIAQ